MKQQFLEDIGGTIRLTTYDKNRALVPSSALITLYENDGTTVLQAQASASVNSTTGEMTYAISSTHAADKGLNYKAVWQYVVSGATYYETQLFDVVKSILSIPITDDDLFAELPSLRKANVQATGTATAGSSSSLTDTSKRKETDDYWKGGTLEIMAGTGSGQSRDITGFTQSTAVITVDPAWATMPDTTSVYRAVKSFSKSIEQCFEKIEQMLYDKGKRDALILEASQIRIPLIYLTLHTISLDLRDEVDDKWDMTQKSYYEMFKQAWSNLTLDYDEDESGGIQGDEAQQGINVIRIHRS